MSTAPKAGVIVYSNNIKKLAHFYSEMFALSVLRETDEFISIAGEELSIVIHVPPIEMPEGNFNKVKIFFPVASHEKAQDKAVRLGGKALEGVWSNSQFKVCNIADPEGNHIQLREFAL